MLSVVIPALNAGRTIGECLRSLGPVDEVIVVDGGSSDPTADLADAAGARVIVAPKGRGKQLRAGAGVATGEWLLFLHADTLLGPQWRSAVASHVATGKEAACFRFRLDDDAWQARLLELGVRLRVRLLGLAYGDQGLLIARTLYDEVGGYRTLPLMEDVDLIRRIGRGRLQVLDEVAVTSAERWRRDGWWRRSVRNLACLALWAMGASPERIARVYQ
jgi:rSAM/selenodomain-associated transferase 2